MTRQVAAGVGRAGRRGDDVRSDLWAEVELREAGGIDVELRSRVEAYYGQAIRDQVQALLRALGVKHARVAIDDQGALPFVIAARVEAAVREAGHRPAKPALPEPRAAVAPRSGRDRMRRSRLYLPGNEPKYMLNAGLHRADGIILDLEDSVHPEAKPAARLLVRNALAAIDFGLAERMVRINQLPLGLEDLEAVAALHPEVFLIPKVEHPDQVREVDAAIDRILGNRDGDEPPWIMPILESALGIEHAFAIARASRRIVALTIGLEDYAADLGLPKSAEGEESVYARTRLVNAARAAGLVAIDSVYGQVDDIEGLKRWAERARALGFRGMGCVHPRQISVIHEAFDPRPAEIDRALRIVAAYEDSKARGLGVVSLGSKMIDPPVIQQALFLIDQARAAGRLDAADGAAGEENR